VDQRAVLEDAGINHQAEVLRAGALDEVDVAIGDAVSDRCRRVDFRQIHDAELVRKIEVALDIGLPLRIGDQARAR
jgi:SpoVK/Ycf46/Vps4 family AAA+-type ATPase